MAEHQVPGPVPRLKYGNVWSRVEKGCVIAFDGTPYRLSSIDEGSVLHFSLVGGMHLDTSTSDLVIPIHGQCVVNGHAIVVVDNDSESYHDWLVSVAPIAETRIALVRTSPHSHITNKVSLYFDADGDRSNKVRMNVGANFKVGNSNYRINHIHLPNKQTGVVGWIGATENPM